jgi:uncharacterized protein
MIIDSHVHLEVYTDKEIAPKKRIENLKKIMMHCKISKSIVLTDIEDNSLSMDEIISLLKNEKDILLVGTIRTKSVSHKEIKRLRNLLIDKKIIGIKLYPGYEEFYPSDKKCNPIYDLCEEFNVPVIFHSGETLGTGKGMKYSRPEHIDDVAIKRPNLKIIIAHLGNPWINDTMVILNRHKNVYSDISGLVPKYFDSYWKNHYENEIIKVLKWCNGNNKLIFGTDWPFWDEAIYLTLTEQYVEFVNKLKISKEDKERIFYLNAKKVFNLD